MVRIQVLYFEGCPNHRPTVELARQVVANLGVDAEIKEIEVKDVEQAERLRFLGSPSVQIDGVDVEPEARSRTDYAFSCRIYGAEGIPQRALLEAALSQTSSATRQIHDCCPPQRATRHDERPTSIGRAGLWAAGGSVVSAVTASACCWLPLLLVAFGVSAAGVSAAFEKVRPLFLTVCTILLAVGFYLLYVRREACAPDSACAVPNPKRKRVNRAMLWVATAFVLAFAFFPKYAGFVLGQTTSRAVQGNANDSRVVTLTIEGMTCEACAITIQKALSGVPGVRTASVDYAEGKALIALDPALPLSNEALIRAVHEAGYTAKLASEPAPEPRERAQNPLILLFMSVTLGSVAQVVIKTVASHLPSSIPNAKTDGGICPEGLCWSALPTDSTGLRTPGNLHPRCTGKRRRSGELRSAGGRRWR